MGSGAEFGVSLTYKIQEAAGGIAEALELAEGFILPGERFVVLLGDNLFKDSLEPYVKSYLQQPHGYREGAPEACRGCAQIRSSGV